MSRSAISLYIVLILGLTLTALADWFPTEPAKWVQLPDETETGIDINCSREFILADDFQCTELGPITAIHIWGSWRSDYLPFGDFPDSVTFVLRFHTDIPDSLSPTGYSMPDDWWCEYVFSPGEFVAHPWLSGVEEGWMRPPDIYTYPGDQIIWQYNFEVPSGWMWCGQDGTPDDPRTYWLSVQAFPHDPEAFFGWKTSPDHWNDDAVWGQDYAGPWYELRYPPGHPLEPRSIDLAFVIDGVRAVDWGDAPDSPVVPGYPTLAVHNGASHEIGGPYFGYIADITDWEFDGQPDPNALGDDSDGYDDEEGVLIPILVQNQTSQIHYFVVSGGYVDAWIDFNGNGVWEEPAERICPGAWRSPGSHGVNVTPPLGGFTGQTYARFRINTMASLPPEGLALDGEVEDHRVIIEEQQVFKWLQEPDLGRTGIDVEATGDFILADDYLCTESGRVTEIWVWGSWLNDYYGVSPQAIMFELSFHSDIPVGPDGYSIPGDVLWQRNFQVNEFDVVAFAGGIAEGWMIPPDEYWAPADTTCWLYKFTVPANEAFFQEGTADHPIVYWLDVQAIPYDETARFGWKTSLDHWNDNAVWGQGHEPYLGPWFELTYPPNHDMSGYPIDLAFRLTNDPLSGMPYKEAVPEGFGLRQNVPNPFSTVTTITYSLPANGHVRLDIYDVTGRLVCTLADEVQTGGVHTAEWFGHDASAKMAPTGIYFYRLTSGENKTTRKMLYLK